MIIIVRGIFRHFSLHEGQEKQPSLGPQFYPGLFIFSYSHYWFFLLDQFLKLMMRKSRINLSKKSLETIRVELLWREVVRSRFSSVMGNMKILLTMAIVLGALIIVQASSSKEFTLVDTVKNCNCMDYLKWKIWLYSWLSHLSYWPGVPLVEKKRVHHWKDTVRLILIIIEYWNPN